eukprot:CAMPEP_0170175976 /NCGR_PEP_ID=MMETSP0040_2-20121228/8946_1 /TAXON_ID=641309 /ORGANISM="Lotharella oceanica, Strain CCMP622" /LENGTH=72 /DNA_ID=CAMNT_0010418145 /DNA_START=517 /DNA_END=732 /DNA_ORIENTATION=+
MIGFCTSSTPTVGSYFSPGAGGHVPPESIERRVVLPTPASPTSITLALSISAAFALGRTFGPRRRSQRIRIS